MKSIYTVMGSKNPVYKSLTTKYKAAKKLQDGSFEVLKVFDTYEECQAYVLSLQAQARKERA